MIRITSSINVWGPILFAFATLFYPCTANAQSTSGSSGTSFATVMGAVQQSNGSPVANATVQLAGTRTLVSQSDVTGTFVFSHVPYGNYRVVVNVKGLGQATREHIIV